MSTPNSQVNCWQANTSPVGSLAFTQPHVGIGSKTTRAGAAPHPLRISTCHPGILPDEVRVDRGGDVPEHRERVDREQQAQHPAFRRLRPVLRPHRRQQRRGPPERGAVVPEPRSARGVELELVHARRRSLVGPNGAGKTTTLRMFAGLMPPTSGEIRVDGTRLDRSTSDRLRRSIGFLTETPGLWEQLTVLDNLRTYARLFGAVGIVFFFTMIGVLAAPGVLGALLTLKTALLLTVVSPLAALTALQMAIAISTRVSDPRSAQQIAVVVVLPIVGLLIGQIAGAFVIGTGILS